MSNVVIFCASVLVCLGVTIWALIWESRTNDGGADERQKIVNGQCGNYSFYTMVFINGVSYLAATRLKLPVNLNIMFLVSILFGGMTYTLCGIWKDAIFTKMWTKKKWIIILFLWILLIFYTSLVYIKNRNVDNLVLSIAETVVLVVVLINLAAKTLYDKRQAKLDAQEE